MDAFKKVFEVPQQRTAALLVLYDHDGVTPTRRDFRTVDEGRKAFERLEKRPRRAGRTPRRARRRGAARL